MIELRTEKDCVMKCQSCGKPTEGINRITTERDDMPTLGSALYLCNHCLERLTILSTMKLKGGGSK